MSSREERALLPCPICRGTNERPILRDDGICDYVPCEHGLRAIIVSHTRVGGYPDTTAIALEAYRLGALAVSDTEHPPAPMEVQAIKQLLHEYDHGIRKLSTSESEVKASIFVGKVRQLMKDAK